MNVDGKSYRTIWVKESDSQTVQIIDQRFLPHQLVIQDLKTVNDVATAILEMQVRGAPLIGVAAAFGMYLAVLKAPSLAPAYDRFLKDSAKKLLATRPTAVNLKWGVERQLSAIKNAESMDEKIRISFETACQIADQDVQNCRSIGEYGYHLIRELYLKKQKPVQILSHCNAGWLACVDWGTATGPIYRAFNEGIPVHVWVSETRPRNQGASLTVWELAAHGVPHTLIVDNAQGHVIQRGLADLVIVGADRVTGTGDVANKIGTYMTALAARAHAVPFYSAFPSSSIDWALTDGVSEIPIEERSSEEVTHIEGWDENSRRKVLLTLKGTAAINYAFDVTPHQLVTGLITERGACPASHEGLLELYPEKKII